MKTKLHKAIPNYPHLGEQIAEGKTKIIYTILGMPGKVLVISKDDITADHGARHDNWIGKGQVSNQTACHVFTLLESCGIPVAFDKQFNENCFIGKRCKMLPYEVVVRRKADGGYLGRNPNVGKGFVFDELVVEFFLKTANQRWKKYLLPCDDPLLKLKPNGIIELFSAREARDSPFLRLAKEEIFSVEKEIDLFQKMSELAQATFMLLEKAWKLQGAELIDLKVEFGVDKEGKLLLADVIDNDSWRLKVGERYICKQSYKDGEELKKVARNYRTVMDLSGRFLLPREKEVYEPAGEIIKRGLK